MTHRHLAGARILAQGLAGPQRWADPTAVARAFAAHQGQDLPGVLASLALRSGGELAPVLAAFDEGRIVRGYPMRGTVFAVEAGTLRWLTELCAGPAVRAAATRRDALGLTDEHVARAEQVLVERTAPVSTRPADADAGPRGVSRDPRRGVPRAELLAAWEEAGIPIAGGCGYHLLVRFISTGLACYGPWVDGDTAVVHAPSWLPAESGLEGTFNGDEQAAIAELALRYFTSHGPATIRDLAWWTKLPMGRIRAALAEVTDQLETGWADGAGRLHADPSRAVASGGEQMFWRPGLVEEYAAQEKDTMRELLLPGFDELVLGYRDRLYLMDADRHAELVPGNNGVFKKSAVRRGEVVGTWTRTGPAGKRRFALTALAAVSPAQEKRFASLFARYPQVVA